MDYLFVALLIFGAFLFFLMGKRASRDSRRVSPAGVGIPMKKEDVESAQRTNDEVMKLLEAKLVASGHFKSDKVPVLIAKLKSGNLPFGRINTTIAFDGDTFLTVDEKRTLGLNTRRKYSKDFIDCFDAASFKTIEPKTTFENMYLDAFHRVSSKNELLRLKNLGFVKQVKIMGTGDSDDCCKIKQSKKVYEISETPALPLVGCDAPYCRCMYQPIIRSDD